MTGHLRGQRLIALCLKGAGRPLVQRRPLAGQQRGGHRLGQQRMPGPVRRLLWAVSEQPCRGELSQPGAHRRRLQPGDAAQLRLGQRPPRDRQRRQRRPPAVAAPARPRHQQLRQPFRQLGRRPQPASRRARLRGGHQLLGEKRVALGPGVQVIGKPRRRWPAHQAGDLFRRLTAGQRSQPDLLHRVPAAHVRQPVGHRAIQRRLIAAAGRHHGHRAAAGNARQIGQAVQRRAVRPVHILDHQTDRSPPGQRLQQLTQRGKQPLTPPSLPSLARFHLVRPQPRQQSRRLHPHVFRDRRQRRLQQPATIQPAQLTQRLRDRQQRQLLGQRQAPSPRRDQPVGRGPAHAFPGEPRLADTSIPDHKDHPRVAAQRRAQARQLTLPADKPRHPGHVPSPPAHARPGQSLLAAFAVHDRRR